MAYGLNDHKCLADDEDKIQNALKNFTQFDLTQRLKYALQICCSKCCLLLIQSCDLQKTKVLFFKEDAEWNTARIRSARVINGECQRHVPLIYLAINAELLEVVKHIVDVCPEELHRSYAQCSILQFTFLNSRKMLEYFLNLQQGDLLLTPVSTHEKHSDLVAALKYEEKYCLSQKFPFEVLKQSFDSLAKMNPEVKDPELTKVVEIACRTDNCRILDLVLDKNRNLLSHELLVKAFHSGALDICDLLLDKYQMNINDQSPENGPRLLDCATTNCKIQAMNYLLNRGADPSLLFSRKKLSKTDQLWTCCSPSRGALYDIAFLIQDLSTWYLKDALDMTSFRFNTILYCFQKLLQGRVLGVFIFTDIVKILLPRLLHRNQTKTLVRFESLCYLLHSNHIFDFNSIVNQIVSSAVDKNLDVWEEFQGFSVLLKLVSDDPRILYTKKSPETYYTQQGFQSIKDCISILDYNRICQGRELASLQRHCRSVIRKQIFLKINFHSEFFIFRSFAALYSLRLPKRLINYLIN